MIDIKVNVTTNAIYHSLFRLLESNSFDEISVNDICRESLISRTTFYSYFEDKYVLVLFCLNQERNQLGLLRGKDVHGNLITFLNRIKEKRVVYKNLLVSHINQELREMIAHQFVETVDLVLDENINEEERQILSYLYTGGISFVVMKWINQDCKYDVTLIADTIWNQISSKK